MDYSKFVEELTNSIDQDAMYVVIYNHDASDNNIYGDYEVSCILAESLTTNLYEPIKRITRETDVVIYAMKFINDEYGLPRMVPLGVLNEDGQSWKPVGYGLLKGKAHTLEEVEKDYLYVNDYSSSLEE